MPLILVCGPPSCGKTFVAKALFNYFSNKNYIVTLVNEETLGLDKMESYSDNYGEMNLRSSIKTAIYQVLSTPGTSTTTKAPSSSSFNTSPMPSIPSPSSSPICICDSLNYVRGYRYELFCIARQFLTTYSVVYCRQPLADSFLWNNSEERLTNKYSEELFIDLWSRFEIPKAENHWEKPLFQIPPAKSFLSSLSMFSPALLSFLPSPALLSTQKKVKSKKEMEKKDFFSEVEEDADGDEEEWKNCLKVIEALSQKRKVYVEERKGNLVDDEDGDFGDGVDKEVNKKKEQEKEMQDAFRAFLFPTVDEEFILDSLSSVILFQDIENSLFNTTGLTAPRSTQQEDRSDSATLYELGVVTQAVTVALLDMQKISLPGDSLTVPGCSDRFILPKTYSPNELRRLRKRFLTMCQHTALAGSKTELGNAFLGFLAQQN